MAKYLFVHNYYQQRGGEDVSFEAESRLLESYGHHVVRYTRHNNELDQLGPSARAKALLWNTEVYRELRELIREERPSLVHVNNTFPLISPSAYYAARAENLPVVQNIRNYRLACLNGLFFRDGQVCEKCLGRLPLPGVRYACYRQNYIESLGAFSWLALHRMLQTWKREVDIFVTLTNFTRDKHAEIGLPIERITVKPNFLNNPPAARTGHASYVLFVGRLSSEKGLNTLVQAWQHLSSPPPLKIAGDGPMADKVADVAARNPSVKWLGTKEHKAVYALMQDAYVLVFPSIWYETFGRVGMEAFASGTPVIASNLGAMQSLVDHERTGLLFRPGDPEDLAAKVRWLWNHPEERAAMGRAARTEYEEKYTAERNYELLMQIYRDAIAHRRRAGA